MSWEGIQPRTEPVAYTVLECGIVLPVTGATRGWRVMRVYAGELIEGPCVAVFANGRAGMGKEMAEKYAEYLTLNKLEVV